MLFGLVTQLCLVLSSSSTAEKRFEGNLHAHTACSLWNQEGEQGAVHTSNILFPIYNQTGQNLCSMRDSRGTRAAFFSFLPNIHWSSRRFREKSFNDSQEKNDLVQIRWERMRVAESACSSRPNESKSLNSQQLSSYDLPNGRGPTYIPLLTVTVSQVHAVSLF